jgi:hypothetical protein
MTFPYKAYDWPMSKARTGLRYYWFTHYTKWIKYKENEIFVEDLEDGY